MSLAERAVKHPITTFMVFTALLLLGIITINQIGIELFPDVTYPTAVVVTIHPGVGPYDIENNITRHIEESVSTLNGVEQVSSTSSEGISMVVINFSWGTNLDSIVPDIREKVNDIEKDLPEAAYRPSIFRFNPEQLPSLVLNCSSRAPALDLRKLVEKNIKPELEKIEGVAQADIYGEKIAAVTCNLRLDDLAKIELSLLQILQVFQGENINLPAGSISLKNKYIVLRTIGEFADLTDIGDVLIGYKENVAIYLRDVADIELGYLIQEEFVRANNYPAVQISIRRQPGHNTVEINNAVKKRIQELRETLPSSVDITIQTDQSASILDSIGGVANAGWQGGLLAIIVLLLFLRNIRSTVIISVAIPLSVVATFALMFFADISMNMTSLMGITLGIGMFVDNSIVVLEANYRKQLSGLLPVQAAVEGTKEVGMAITASTLTTIAVFLPLVFVQGLGGMLFHDISYTISFALVISLAVALTLIPVMCARFLRLRKGSVIIRSNGYDHSELSLADVEVNTKNRILNAISRLIQRALKNLDNAYEKLIKWALHHSFLVIISAIILLTLSIGSILLLGMEFIPEADEGKFSIGMETKTESPYRVTEQKVIEAEGIVINILDQDLVSLSSKIGSAGSMLSTSQTSSHLAQIQITLTDKDKRNRSIWQLVQEISTALKEQLTDVDFKITIEGMSSLVTTATGSTSAIVVEISGQNLDQSHAYAQQVAGVMKKVKGTRDVEISYQSGKPEFQFRILRREAAGLGLNLMEIAATIRTAYKGTKVSTFRQGEDTYDILLILRPEDRNSLEGLDKLFLINPAGTKIALTSVVHMEQEEGPLSIKRKKRERIMEVNCALTGQKPLSDVLADIKQAVNGLGAPPLGISLAYHGSGEQMEESFSDMLWALILAVALVYIIMASQFESLLHPLIVMFSVPFAIIGLVVALLITNTTFNLVAFVGGITLVGIVVNNAIVLIDYMNQLQKQGITLKQAIIRACKTRLKPILMTTITTIVGLLPMSLGLGGGAELRAPMGRAVVGGLTTSTLITLVLIPVIYNFIESRLKRKKQKVKES